jgi:Asp/Glu/hydantoin racemase
LIDEFAVLCREFLPDVRTFHILDEPLLERIRIRGHGAPEDERRLAEHFELATAVGADAVLVTCSTTSLLVDAVRDRFDLPVITIDAAMAAEAIRAGSRVALVATNETTVEPSRALVEAEAARVGRRVEVSVRVVPNALAALLEGDSATHDQLVEQAIRAAAADADVVVLAQASMARVLRSIERRSLLVPLLSSPELAMQHVRRQLSITSPAEPSSLGVPS